MGCAGVGWLVDASSVGSDESELIGIEPSDGSIAVEQQSVGWQQAGGA